ncbi:hypothetical protein, partial [Richelia intracellularis]|uniref:hypothetical protein n=1 Tax=Richelia intracellularis TaxID=1164990 RepID=UPI0005C4A0ED
NDLAYCLLQLGKLNIANFISKVANEVGNYLIMRNFNNLLFSGFTTSPNGFGVRCSGQIFWDNYVEKIQDEKFSNNQTIDLPPLSKLPQVWESCVYDVQIL